MVDELTLRAHRRVGRVLAEKYRIDEVLGVGGTAAVFAATHRNGYRVALKMLHAELSLQEAVRARFQREGYLANRIAHPGVVRVMDDDVDADGSAYLVMELLAGATVERRVAEHGGRLDIDLTLGIADAALGALAAAHEASIVHRDIKPANLFLTSLGELKVLDFGAARWTEGASITQTGELWGTPGFMSPEQARGQRAIDHRTDIWAVGAVIFRLLSGAGVHAAATDQLQLVHVATRPAPPLASAAPRTPAAICEVVDRALAFDRDSRWDSARRMLSALRKSHDYDRL